MTNHENVVANCLKKGLENVDVDIAVSGMSADLSEFDVTLTFKTGVAYCCTEYGCFLPLQNKDVYEEIHAAVGGEKPITIRSLRAVVEKGVKIKPSRGMSGWTTDEATEYTVGPFHEEEAG